MSTKWIYLGTALSPEYIAKTDFFERVYEQRFRPAEETEDVFGDLRSLFQNGFTGGEDWEADWSKRFPEGQQQQQMMAYLSSHLGQPITTMNDAFFEFDFFVMKALHRNMEAAGLHKPIQVLEPTAMKGTLGLEKLTVEQVDDWEDAHQRTLPDVLKRTYTELFGGAFFVYSGEISNWYLMGDPTKKMPNLLTLEALLHQEDVSSVDRTLSRIQYSINRLASGKSQKITSTEYAKLVQPKLRQALVLERYSDDNHRADFLYILVEFGPLDQHVVQLVDVIQDDSTCTVSNEGPLNLWLIRTYLNAWLDLGV